MIRKCPFCDVDMIRPRAGEYKESEPALQLYCTKFKTDDHSCPHCVSYNEHECPKCGVLLFYRV